MVLTYRGKPVARLEPLQESTPGTDDPFYKLADLAGLIVGVLLYFGMSKRKRA